MSDVTALLIELATANFVAILSKLVFSAAAPTNPARDAPAVTILEATDMTVPVASKIKSNKVFLRASLSTCLCSKISAKIVLACWANSVEMTLAL